MISFEEGEVVCAQTDNAVIWLHYVSRAIDDQFALGFGITYKLHESRTVLLPYQISKYVGSYTHAHARYVSDNMDRALMAYAHGPNEKIQRVHSD